MRRATARPVLWIGRAFGRARPAVLTCRASLRLMRPRTDPVTVSFRRDETLFHQVQRLRRSVGQARPFLTERYTIV